MDDLRKEFDALMKKDIDECDDGSCENAYEEEYADYIVELTTKMLVPERCGLYFSKKDFRDLGLAFELSISLKQRVRMITDLLKSIFTIEDMQKMFNNFNTLIDHKIATYNELATTFPSSKTVFENHIHKAEKLKKDLARILDESQGIL